jgi:hypothetical protein
MRWVGFDERMKQLGLTFGSLAVTTEEREGLYPDRAIVEPAPPPSKPTSCPRRHQHPLGQRSKTGRPCQCPCSWCKRRSEAA